MRLLDLTNCVRSSLSYYNLEATRNMGLSHPCEPLIEKYVVGVWTIFACGCSKQLEKRVIFECFHNGREWDWPARWIPG